MVRRIIAAFVFIVWALSVLPLLSAASRPAITSTELYCSGIVSRARPRPAGYVITGRNAFDKLQFFQGDVVYLHVASHADLKTGEQFLVIRKTKDPTRIFWFHGQKKIEKRMGILWEDVGRLRVFRVGDSVASARIENSCAPMERGDLLVPFQVRTAPLPAPPSNSPSPSPGSSPIGRVVISENFRQLLDSGSIAYVNLGTREGVKVGDRISLFRYPGREDLNVYQTPGIATGAKSFGHPPKDGTPLRVPREVIGDAIVLRVSATAATVLITESRREISLGDFAQIE